MQGVNCGDISPPELLQLTKTKLKTESENKKIVVKYRLQISWDAARRQGGADY